MAVLIPNIAERDCLDLIFVAARDPKVHLWTGAAVPSDDSEYSDFDEATFDGYASQNLVPPADALTDGGGNAYIDFGLLTFTSTGATATPAVKGALVSFEDKDGDLTLFAVITFDLPVTITAGGQEIKFTLKTYATKVVI